MVGMSKPIEQTAILDCTPVVAFNAWLDSKQHGEMIDGSAEIDRGLDGKFSIWDGAITGETLEIDEKNHKVVQSWRYNDDTWPEDKASTLTIEFAIEGTDKTKIIFKQINVPEDMLENTSKGWKQYYWKPMQKYFAKDQ